MDRRPRRSEMVKRLRSSGRVRAVTTSPPPSGIHSDDPFQAIVPDTSELEALRQELRDLRRLQEVIHFLEGAPDLVTLRREMLDLALSVGGLRRGMLALRVSSDDALTHKYKVKATRGFDDEDERRTAEVKVLRRMLNRALETRETLIEGDVRGGVLGHAQKDELSLGAVACLPLESGGELLGALILDDPERRRPFSTAELSLLRSFARHAALALLRVAQVHRLGRRVDMLKRRAERIEAERDAALKRLDASRRQLERNASPPSSSVERIERAASARMTRDAIDAMLEVPYRDAKETFTRRYLQQALRRAGGDLRVAANATGLPLARLIGLMDHLDVTPEGRDGEGTWGGAAKR